MPKIPDLRNVNVQKIAKTLSNFQNPSAILPVALIETTVIAGRSYQGYKRGGKDELRERLLEETVTGAFWLGGVASLNKFGDFLGKKFLKLGDLPAVGKDALRDPFSNVLDSVKNKAAIFKFSKIILSALLSTIFIGFALPKFKQKMTGKAKEKEWNNYRKAAIKTPTMAQFLEDNKNKNQLQKATAFKGVPAGLVNGVLSATHNLENNNIWRLVSTDTGIVTGRVKSSRNKYEAREYLFRDVSSMYFYMFATPNMVSLLSKISNNTKIHPEALLTTRDHIIKKMGGSSLSVADFEKSLLNKKVKGVIDKIKFENDVVKLNSLKGILEPDDFKKASLMSILQPKIKGERLLSKQQVQDALSDNWLSDSKFLYKMFKKATRGASSDKNKFVSKKNIEKIRSSVDDFALSIVNYARKKGIEQIDENLVKKLAQRNITLAAAFTVCGVLFSCFGLAFLVPKLQQRMTYKATGKNAFPGTQNYS